jgi:hypothetical protein
MAGGHSFSLPPPYAITVVVWIKYSLFFWTMAEAAQFEEIPLQKGDNNPQSTGKPGDSGSIVLTKSKKIALFVLFVVLVVVIFILAISFIVHVHSHPPKGRFIYLHSIFMLPYFTRTVDKLQRSTERFNIIVCVKGMPFFFCCTIQWLRRHKGDRIEKKLHRFLPKYIDFSLINHIQMMNTLFWAFQALQFIIKTNRSHLSCSWVYLSGYYADIVECVIRKQCVYKIACSKACFNHILMWFVRNTKFSIFYSNNHLTHLTHQNLVQIRSDHIKTFLNLFYYLIT